MPPDAPGAGRTAIGWSAGKDCCLALLRLREQGIAVETFVTMCEPDGRSKAHGLPAELVAAQVAAFGGCWLPVRVPPGGYAAAFDATLRTLRATGHTRMAFGDVDLQAHRDWIEAACATAGLQPLFPLWGQARDALAREVIARGIRARVVAVDTRWLDASFAGADYDTALLARLPAGVCPCGEEGEFHTFVVDAPGMAAPLAIRDAAQREAASLPPFAPTVHVFQDLVLDGSTARSTERSP
jgi:uncharacterized protein (TIGR00290 family)